MRTLIALALVLAACGRDDRTEAPATNDATRSAQRGPDPLVLRVARSGGPARVYSYPRLDSTIWSSAARVPAPSRVLAFDPETGLLALVDRNGLPVRLDFRLGEVATVTRARLTSLASSDGSAIYGIAADGSVSRLTPSGTSGAWPYKPPRPAREVFPQPDGSLVVVTESGGGWVLSRIRPPDTEVLDTVSVPVARQTVRTAVGDRLYFTVDTGLIGVRSRDLAPVPAVRFRTAVRDVVPTPSGDRIYVITDSSAEIAVVDRYREAVARRIELPGIVRELRMDPLGRFLLARPRYGDSVWVVAISADRVTGAVPTAWRDDLPAIAPDGTVALVQDRDVVFADAVTLEQTQRARGGAGDFWYFFFWNGFRPRDPGLDEPVRFPADTVTDSAAPDSAPFSGQSPDSAFPSLPPSPTSSTIELPLRSGIADARITEPRSIPRRSAANPGFYVQLAALLSESRAREIAAGVMVDGAPARVITASQAGTPIHRVVFGPFASRARAQSVGEASRRQFWIYEELP